MMRTRLFVGRCCCDGEVEYPHGDHLWVYTDSFNDDHAVSVQRLAVVLDTPPEVVTTDDIHIRFFSDVLLGNTFPMFLDFKGLTPPDTDVANMAIFIVGIFDSQFVINDPPVGVLNVACGVRRVRLPAVDEDPNLLTVEAEYLTADKANLKNPIESFPAFGGWQPWPWGVAISSDGSGAFATCGPDLWDEGDKLGSLRTHDEFTLNRLAVSQAANGWSGNLPPGTDGIAWGDDFIFWNQFPNIRDGANRFTGIDSGFATNLSAAATPGTWWPCTYHVEKDNSGNIYACNRNFYRVPVVYNLVFGFVRQYLDLNNDIVLAKYSSALAPIWKRKLWDLAVNDPVFGNLIHPDHRLAGPGYNRDLRYGHYHSPSRFVLSQDGLSLYMSVTLFDESTLNQLRYTLLKISTTSGLPEASYVWGGSEVLFFVPEASTIQMASTAVVLHTGSELIALDGSLNELWQIVHSSTSGHVARGSDIWIEDHPDHLGLGFAVTNVFTGVVSVVHSGSMAVNSAGIGGPPKSVWHSP